MIKFSHSKQCTAPVIEDIIEATRHLIQANYKLHVHIQNRQLSDEQHDQ